MTKLCNLNVRYVDCFNVYYERSSHYVIYVYQCHNQDFWCPSLHVITTSLPLCKYNYTYLTPHSFFLAFITVETTVILSPFSRRPPALSPGHTPRAWPLSVNNKYGYSVIHKKQKKTDCFRFSISSGFLCSLLYYCFRFRFPRLSRYLIIQDERVISKQ